MSEKMYDNAPTWNGGGIVIWWRTTQVSRCLGAVQGLSVQRKLTQRGAEFDKGSVKMCTFYETTGHTVCTVWLVLCFDGGFVKCFKK